MQRHKKSLANISHFIAVWAFTSSGVIFVLLPKKIMKKCFEIIHKFHAYIDLNSNFFLIKNS